jgi:DNA-binding LytR/AlgR family response regulator
MSLREIEDSVQHTSFCRISKHMIVNTAHLKAVESYANHRLLLVLKNDDKVLVNRNYVEHLKKQIKKL